MSTEDPGYVCLTCGRVLEELRPGGKTLILRHSLFDATGDHTPVAARMVDDIEALAVLRCDFCAGEPVTHVVALDREIVIPGTDGLGGWDSEWAACRPCAELVLADDWLNLRRRFLAVWGSMFGEETRINLRLAWREVKSAFVMVYQYEYAPPEQVAGK